MIDVRPSNKKLIDRCKRLIEEIAKVSISDKDLSKIIEIRKNYDEKGVYSPSVVKIGVAMLTLKKTPADYEELVSHLAKNQEACLE